MTGLPGNLVQVMPPSRLKARFWVCLSSGWRRCRWRPGSRGFFRRRLPQRPLVLSLSSTVEPLKMATPFSSGRASGKLLPVDEVGRDGVAPAHVAPLVAEGLSWKKRWYWPLRKMGPLGSLIQLGGALKWSWGCQAVAE